MSQPCDYQIHIIGRDDLQHTPFNFTDKVASSLCTGNPPDTEARQYLAALATKYDREVRDKGDWDCWDCDQKAVSILHTPLSYLHRARPQVVDIALPICEARGKCDMDGRKYMAEEVGDMARGRRGMHM